MQAVRIQSLEFQEAAVQHLQALPVAGPPEAINPDLDNGKL